MRRADKHRTPAGRAETDASLRAERVKADEELVGREREAETAAAAVVKTARDRADAVLEAARHREDEKTSGRSSARTKSERSRADAVLAKERAVADAMLDAERVQRQIALAGLLAAERSETDLRLLLERARIDETLINRDNFIAMLSHDLRSLLGTIALNVSMLERQGVDDPARIANYAAAIKRTTAQMTRLVADLLDVASIDAGKLVLVRGRHDAAVLVREAADAFAPTAAVKGLSLVVQIADEDLAGEFDPDRIAQVLGNLLNNAAKFTRPGGTITIAAAHRGDEILFSVADTGDGIPPEKLDTIFERHSQLGRSDRSGLGLGLHISRRIVEAHGGRLWAESKLGQGSTFYLTVAG
jgi:signal transduction histidine kinase